MSLLWNIAQSSNPLQPPAHLSSVSSWHGHMPFAFWLMEVLRPAHVVELGVHAGDSLLAFAEGSRLADHKLRLVGIDTFEGDEHSGKYDPNMYVRCMSQINTLGFGGEVSLIKASFEETVGSYPEGIDLLHIDGLHTLEATRRNFEDWLPKLSPSGVVLMHDTNVTDNPTFGVWRVWAELRDKYPSFNFPHSYGLGMLLVGKERNPLLLELCQHAHDKYGEWVRRWFQVLGDRIRLTED